MTKNESSFRHANNFALACSVAALLAAGGAHGAKPPGPLNATVCAALSGAWSANTCTIGDTASGVASSSFKIPSGVVLDVKGSLLISSGVTVTNSGTLIVENTGGLRTDYDSNLAGILVVGTLDNAGVVNIRNETAYTEGIAISTTLSAGEPPDPNNLVIVPGTLSNSGTIAIQNRNDSTWGIVNMGVLANSASGSITVANSLGSSRGISNKRFLGAPLYLQGTVTNAGSIAISNSSDNQASEGVHNSGSFTNSATGTFTINPDPAGISVGLYNNGNFTSYGTFTNNRGSFNETTLTIGVDNDAGTMVNYGTTYVGTASQPVGTFLNGLVMVNLGKITSYGIMADYSPGATMLNYGTIYNYGLIGGGQNKGFCVDEVAANPYATGC